MTKSATAAYRLMHTTLAWTLLSLTRCMIYGGPRAFLLHYLADRQTKAKPTARSRLAVFLRLRSQQSAFRTESCSAVTITCKGMVQRLAPSVTVLRDMGRTHCQIW